ncbi:MAG: hypothetical protein M5U26_13485 [Planctomycetota bacterium]|nr:hypothetical protein [Planctomycetota bacterium]
MLAKIDALLERLALRKTELGDATEMGQQLKGLQERMDERLKVLDQDPKIVQHLGVVDAARKDLEAAQKRSLGLGQGGDVTGGDPAMVTTDDFVDQLHGVLVQMGPEALPVVVRFKGHANKAVRERAQQILGEWERPQYAKAFALAAAEPDPTPVQLKAKAFLKETLKLKAAEALIPALKDAADEEKPALYAALKSIAANDLPDEPAAWEDWLKKIKAGSTPDKPVPEEEEK